jgi:hypothetical protein
MKTDTDTRTTPPTLPYAVHPFLSGPGEGIQRYAKVGGPCSGDLLTDDEIGVWNYVQYLQNENARLALALELAPLDAPTVPAEVAGALPNPSSPLAQANANSEESVAETAADKRARVTSQLLASPGDSNGLVAERAGVSDEYVRKLRKQMEAEGKLAPVSTVARKGGGVYPIANGGTDSLEGPALGDVATTETVPQLGGESPAAVGDRTE